MKPVIKNKTAVFHPQGFLDGNNAPFIIDSNDRLFLKNKNDIEAVLVSLKKVIFFNKNGLSIILDILQDIESNKKNIIIGFIDYDQKKFDTMIKIFKREINFNLFENQEIASLLIGDVKEKDKDKKILVWNDDTEQKNIITVELIERGYSPVIAKNKGDFVARESTFDIGIQNSYLGFYNKKVVAKIKDNIIIYVLRDYIDSEFSNIFDINYHYNLLRVGFKLFVFDISHVSSINIHGINFLARLATGGAEYDTTFALAGFSESKVTKSLKENLEDTGILFYDSIENFFKDEKTINEAMQNMSFNQKNRQGITKEIVKNLPVFIDSAITTIEVMSQISAVKKSVDAQELKIADKEGYYAATIGIYGFFECLIILVFSKKLIEKSCHLLLDEEKNIDENLLVDTLGEFVNIIGGKTKAELAKQNIKIDITLPRTYKDIKSFIQSQKGKKGIQVNFEFDNEPFYFYISNSY